MKPHHHHKQRGVGRTLWLSGACLLVLGIIAGMARWARSITAEPLQVLSSDFKAKTDRARAASKAATTLKARATAIKAKVVEARLHADDAPAADAHHAKTATPPSQVVKILFEASAWPAKKAVTLRLLPEFSAESVAFLHEAARSSCPGQLYRVEKSFLIQGRISCARGATQTKVVKAGCPSGVAVDTKRICPSHDPQCGCHGPIMARGMVGWAGGSAGPDWFIYSGGAPATHWSHDHTVFAVVEDDESWATISEIGKLPVKNAGMTMLVTPLQMSIEEG